MLNVDTSVDNVVDGDAPAHVDGPVNPSNNLDAVTGFDAFADLAAPIEFGAFTGSNVVIGPDHSVNNPYGTRCNSADCDLGDIVDRLFRSSPSASLGRFPTSRLTRQAKPKLAEVP